MKSSLKTPNGVTNKKKKADLEVNVTTSRFVTNQHGGFCWCVCACMLVKWYFFS